MSSASFSPRRLILLISIGVLLLGAIGLVTFTALQPKPTPTLTQPLAELLPKEIAGWTVKDQPIAETQEMKKAVGELLNYDDALSRTYSQGDTSIAVYVAYWKPGKMSPRLVAGHTPDVCWVNNGWRCTNRDFEHQINISAPSIHIAQAGTYETSGKIQNVLFWHLHQNRLVAYNTGGQPPWWSSISDIWNRGLNQRGEQFFIRISSNLAIEEIETSEVFQLALQALGPVALYIKSSN